MMNSTLQHQHRIPNSSSPATNITNHGPYNMNQQQQTPFENYGRHDLGQQQQQGQQQQLPPAYLPTYGFPQQTPTGIRMMPVQQVNQMQYGRSQQAYMPNIMTPQAARLPYMSQAAAQSYGATPVTVPPPNMQRETDQGTTLYGTTPTEPHYEYQASYYHQTTPQMMLQRQMPPRSDATVSSVAHNDYQVPQFLNNPGSRMNVQSGTAVARPTTVLYTVPNPGGSIGQMGQMYVYPGQQAMIPPPMQYQQYPGARMPANMIQMGHPMGQPMQQDGRSDAGTPQQQYQQQQQQHMSAQYQQHQQQQQQQLPPPFIPAAAAATIQPSYRPELVRPPVTQMPQQQQASQVAVPPRMAPPKGASKLMTREEWMAQTKSNQSTEPKKPSKAIPIIDPRSNQEIQLKDDSSSKKVEVVMQTPQEFLLEQKQTEKKAPVNTPVNTSFARRDVHISKDLASSGFKEPVSSSSVVKDCLSANHLPASSTTTQVNESEPVAILPSSLLSVEESSDVPPVIDSQFTVSEALVESADSHSSFGAELVVADQNSVSTSQPSTITDESIDSLPLISSNDPSEKLVPAEDSTVTIAESVEVVQPHPEVHEELETSVETKPVECEPAGQLDVHESAVPEERSEKETTENLELDDESRKNRQKKKKSAKKTEEDINALYKNENVATVEPEQTAESSVEATGAGPSEQAVETEDVTKNVPEAEEAAVERLPVETTCDATEEQKIEVAEEVPEVQASVSTPVDDVADAEATEVATTETDAKDVAAVDAVPEGIATEVAAVDADTTDLVHEETAPEASGLKLKYDPDQWSPFNPTGKKCYSRDFLMQLRQCPEAQRKLPDIAVDIPDVIRTVGETQTRPEPRDYNRQPSSGYADFTPGFAKFSQSNMNRAPPKRGSQKRNEMPSQHKVINFGIQQDVQLHKTEAAWKPSMPTLSKPVISDDTVELYKATRGVLNKLTPENFDKLLVVINALPIKTEDQLSGCIQIIFEKAISEPTYCNAYAKMAFSMCQGDKMIKVPTNDNPSELVSFRKLLLNRCQSEFEKEKASELDLEKIQKKIDEAESAEERKALTLEKEIEMTKVRRRTLGNIRFIGELFKFKMLTEKIMFECIVKLIRATEEESIECLCWLVRTVGKDLDNEKNKKSLDGFFNDINKKLESKTISNRTRFMMRDIIELRLSKWVPRRNDNNPKTIQQIHKEAADEAYAKQQMANAPLPSYTPNQQRPQRPTGRDGPPSLEKQAPEDGWTMAPTKGLRNTYEKTPIDLRMKLPKASMSENITLGPTSRSNWAFGSSGGGSRTSSQELDKTSMQSNRFTALQHGASGMDSYESAGARPKNNKDQTMRRTAIRGSQEMYSGGASSNTRDKNERSSSPATNGSRNASRDSSVGFDSASSAAGGVDKRAGDVPSKSSVALSAEEIERRTKSLLLEYFSAKDLKEAMLCVDDLNLTSSNTATFVSYVVSFVLEKKPADLVLTGSLFRELILREKLDKAAFVGGLKEVLQDAESFEIDIPKIWENLGDLFSAFTKDNSDYFRLVVEGCEPLVPIGKISVVLANTLSRIAKNLSNDRASKVWLESELIWSSYVKEGLFSFAHKQNVEFLNPVQKELLLLLKHGSDKQQIFDWIEKNVTPEECTTRTFVRALMTAVCQYSMKATTSGYTLDRKTMLEYQPLLQRYLDHQPDQELQALYAVQALVHSFEHPSGILETFFEHLYEQEIISEDAFWDWEKSEDPAEQTGKGVAHTATKAFYKWLNETPEESVS